MAEREAKPPWSAVPATVKARAEELVGAGVVRAVRAYGGYGPSATFTLTLADGRRAFFKGSYPLPDGSGVQWMLDDEEPVYQKLAEFIRPWAPEYHGSFRADGWHVVLLEAVAGDRMPPWTRSQARRAAESFARFHASSVGRRLPGWLPRDTHIEFAGFWREFVADDDGLRRVASVAGARRKAALNWLKLNIGALVAAEERLAGKPRRTALLHFDTRSDNVRLDGDLLRIFDWPFACVGPPEFDLFAFAQSIESEGGPPGEEVVHWYESVLSVDRDVLVSSAAGLAGYFADRAPRPAIDGLPRLRSVQRRQLKASLRLAARLMGLSSPDWLDSVPD